MNILFYLYPGILPLGPIFNAAWTDLFCQLADTLAASGKGQYCLVTGSRFSFVTKVLPEEVRVGFVNETEFHRNVRAVNPVAATPSVLTWLADNEKDTSHPAIALLVEHIVQASNGFKPDMVITFGLNAHYLKTVWQDIVLLHVEAGSFCKKPYPFSLFFDHRGMYRTSVPAQIPFSPLIQDISEDTLTLANDFRKWSEMKLRVADPFSTADLKKKFDRLVLFPLQVSHYHSFEEHTHHQTQFEYLYDFLSQSPREVGIIVSEYIQWGHILEEQGPSSNLGYLKSQFPNLIFLPYSRKFNTPSQYLISAVDGIWTVVSNLGYQGLLLKKRLGTSPGSYLRNVAHNHSPDIFFKNLDKQPDDRLSFLAWYLDQYLVPSKILKDSVLLYDYFERRLTAVRSAATVEAGFVAIAPNEILRDAWIIPQPSDEPDTWTTPATSQVHRRVIADISLARLQSNANSLNIDEKIDSFGAIDSNHHCRCSYILLNEPAPKEGGLHFGYNAATEYIRDQFSALGMKYHGTANSGADCHKLQNVPGFDKVRLILFNDEGDLQHNPERYEELLRFCSTMKTRGCRCVLINTAWHENFELMGFCLNLFDIVTVTESISAEAIKPWRSDLHLVPDISLAAFRNQVNGFNTSPLALNNKVKLAVIGTAAKPASAKLQRFAELHQFPFFGVGQPPSSEIIDQPNLGYEVCDEVFPRVLRDHRDIAVAHGCLTDNFHGLVASLVSGVPVVCPPSITPKIEGLLNDFGIRNIALLPAEWLSCGDFQRLDIIETYFAQWSEDVLASVNEHVSKATRAIDQLLVDIGTIVI